MRFKLIIFGIFLASAVTVWALAATDTTITLSTAEKDALDDVGLDSFEVSEMTCDGSICKFRLFKEDRINNEMFIEDTGTDAELLEARDEAIQARLEEIANATIERQARSESVKHGAGNVTVVGS